MSLCKLQLILRKEVRIRLIEFLSLFLPQSIGHSSPNLHRNRLWPTLKAVFTLVQWVSFSYVAQLYLPPRYLCLATELFSIRVQAIHLSTVSSCPLPVNFRTLVLILVSPYFFHTAVFFLFISITILSFTAVEWGHPGAEHNLLYHCPIVSSLLNQISNFDVLVSVHEYIRVQVLVRRNHVWNLLDVWRISIRRCECLLLLPWFDS